MEGKVIIFSAPSGSGKSTIVHHLLRKHAELSFSISATTRSPRTGEKEGIDYHFLSPEEFRRQVKSGEFIEWEEVYADTFYGTLKKEVEKVWSRGNNVIFDVDVAGGYNLKKYFGKQALSFFVKVPSLQVLEERLKARNTESPESLQKRIEKAQWELTYADKFDVILLNDQLNLAVEEASRIYQEFVK